MRDSCILFTNRKQQTKFKMRTNTINGSKARFAIRCLSNELGKVIIAGILAILLGLMTFDIGVHGADASNPALVPEPETPEIQQQELECLRAYEDDDAEFSVADQMAFNAVTNAVILMRASCLDGVNEELQFASQRKNRDINGIIAYYDHLITQNARELDECIDACGPEPDPYGSDEATRLWQLWWNTVDRCYWPSAPNQIRLSQIIRERNAEIAEVEATFEAERERLRSELSRCQISTELAIQRMWDDYHLWHRREHSRISTRYRECLLDVNYRFSR